MQKLNGIAQRIGLTATEVKVICYTSLDLEWMPNLLILASEFTKWFNINFEGDSRDEIDFRDNKVEIWAAVQTYAGYIINEVSTMSNKEAAIKKGWWEKLRFKKFGNEMASKFKAKPQLMTTLR